MKTLVAAPTRSPRSTSFAALAKSPLAPSFASTMTLGSFGSPSGPAVARPAHLRGDGSVDGDDVILSFALWDNDRP